MTDKERAQKYRQIAALFGECGKEQVEQYWNEIADRLDPPKPEIPDGHVWYRYYGTTPQDWSPGLKLGDRILNQYGQRLSDSRLEVIPTRTLDPGQVAVDRELILSAAGYLQYDPMPHRQKLSAKLQDALDRDMEANK